MTSGDDPSCAIVPLAKMAWRAEPSAELSRQALLALERGDVLFFPGLAFERSAQERAAFAPATSGASKNVSFDPATGRLSGAAVGGDELRSLTGMIARFSEQAAAFVTRLFPRYAALRVGRASFRPVEIAGRRTSWRKDDTRLHVDAFPATPSAGRRILRIFSNVNPEGRPRQWRVGERFEAAASRFAPALSLPWPGAGRAMHWLRLTKSPRTPYDALMLQLHDRMKADLDYQTHCAQRAFDFPADSTWLAFTDQVPHAATAGQFQLEQTFLVPVEAMENPERSPLRILERLTGRTLT